MDFIWHLTNLIVWSFEVFVYLIIASLVIHVIAPGNKKGLLHKIYTLILDFPDDEEDGDY